MTSNMIYWLHDKIHFLVSLVVSVCPIYAIALFFLWNTSKIGMQDYVWKYKTLERNVKMYEYN